jgi:hypothetical protein
MNFAESGLAGPFNFSMTQQEPHRIDDEIWKILEEHRNIDLKDLD